VRSTPAGPFRQLTPVPLPQATSPCRKPTPKPALENNMLVNPTIRIPIDPGKPHFVWIYWHGGAQGDEIRWSLRSVCRHFDNPNCWVIGDPPTWYGGNVIRMNRIAAGPTFRPYADQWRKVKAAIDCEQIPRRFCWIMDDVYFLQPVKFDSLEVPRRVRVMSVRGVNTMRSRNLWRRYKRLTMDVLISRGLPLGDYVTHGPAIMDKQKMRQVMEDFNVMSSPLSWELIYYNSFDWPEIRSWRSWMTRITGPGRNLERITTPICNNSVNGWSPGLREWLMRKFPDRSIVETEDAPETIPFSRFRSRSLRPIRRRRPDPAAATNRLDRMLREHIGGTR